MKNIKSKLNMLAIAGIALATISIASCKKSSGGNSITPIAGYDSSGAVATANLIAYWPFEGTPNDVKGGLIGTATGVSYTAGIKGQAYQGSTTSSIQIPLTTGNAFASIQSFSLSVWYNDPTQVTTPNHGLFMMSGVSNWNLLELEFERDSTGPADSVKVNAGFNNVDGVNYKGIVPSALLDTAVNRWVHLVLTYDGGSSTYTLYQDGVTVKAQTAWSSGLYASTPAQIWTDGTATVAMGNIGFTADPPTGITIGAFSPLVAGNSWAGSFPGKLDEIRVYNKALSLSEVAGLYLNGLAGR
jgi:Concanavalin A-like lectin/glucanases superfamily